MAFSNSTLIAFIVASASLLNVDAFAVLPHNELVSWELQFDHDGGARLSRQFSPEIDVTAIWRSKLNRLGMFLRGSTRNASHGTILRKSLRPRNGWIKKLADIIWKKGRKKNNILYRRTKWLLTERRKPKLKPRGWKEHSLSGYFVKMSCNAVFVCRKYGLVEHISCFVYTENKELTFFLLLPKLKILK